MKKIYALLLSTTAVFQLNAQVVVEVLQPAELQGHYVNTWAKPAAGSWATPDMEVPTNAVTGELAFALDGTDADSLACEAIENGSEISGKVAILYRGTCDFSVKALNCQQAGAIAVLIISNQPVPPTPLGAGSVGAQVTIPVFMISQADGATFRATIDAGTPMQVFLGAKNGFYADDAGFDRNDLLYPPSSAIPKWLATNASEYNFQLAAWMHNYGTNDQASVTLSATVTQGGPPLYSEAAASVAIPAGDSAFVTLPDFSQPSYDGEYTVTYISTVGSADQYIEDNTFSMNLLVDSLYAVGPIDPVTHWPVPSTGIQPATSNGDFTSCIHFRDANASRLAVTGMDVYAVKNLPGSMSGDVLNFKVMEWQDEFTGVSDANFALDQIVELNNTEYIVDLDSNVFNAYIPLSEPVVLQDNMRYLFCVTTSDPDVFLGYNQNVSYVTNLQVYDQPINPFQNGPDWSIGFVGDPVATLTARMIRSSDVGVAENLAPADLQPYPNPARNEVRIPLNGFTGTLDLRIMDLAGKIVSAQRVAAGQGSITADVSGVAPGTFSFELSQAGSKSVSFKVVIAR